MVTILIQTWDDMRILETLGPYRLRTLQVSNRDVIGEFDREPEILRVVFAEGTHWQVKIVEDADQHACDQAREAIEKFTDADLEKLMKGVRKGRT